jgi:2-polyprenyl-3-methyl-5-hydroxy-6-metoxy-1,4-benzoquinol methylase
MKSHPPQQASFFTETCPCNNCGHAAPRRLYTEWYRVAEKEVELGIGKCPRCGLVYISPRLSAQAMSYVYGADAEATISHNYCWNGASDGFRFAGIIRRLKTIQPEGNLLDIGCGAGQFLVEAKRAGRWTVTGLEPHEPAAAHARRAAECSVHNAALDDTSWESGSFDVVTMFGVLEHLHDPRGGLQHVHRLLRPGGVLAVYVPNFHYLRLKDAGLIAWLRTGRWSNLHPQEHLFQYTPQSVRQMLDNTGFQCLRMDIGRPFLNCGGIRRVLKRTAYHLVWSIQLLSGIHLGGIEVLARRVASDETLPRVPRVAA